MTNLCLLLAIASAVTLLLPSIATAQQPATRPLLPASRVIASDQLVVELMDPADPQRYNRGVRFTPVAAVIRANLQGHEFLAYEHDPNPLQDVAGLFAEFDLASAPTGFEQAAIGEPFVKIGVGALRKDNAKYNFFHQYPVEQLAKTTVDWSPDSADFLQDMPTLNGYGYQLRAHARVAGRDLTIDWTLTNTGTLPFTTEQYLHNSFRFDGHAIGPGYVLEFPFDFTARGMRPEQKQTGRSIAFLAPVTDSGKANIKIDLPAESDGPSILTLHHTELAMAARCETSVPCSRIAVHVAPAYICPEQFIQLDLSPGQSISWTRRYSFSAQ